MLESVSCIGRCHYKTNNKCCYYYYYIFV